MTMPSISRIALCLLLLPAVAAGQEVRVIEHELDNGMTLLLVPRPGDPNIAAGWVAKVGSVNERPGITGVAHLFEHMMFKGTARHRHHRHRAGSADHRRARRAQGGDSRRGGGADRAAPAGRHRRPTGSGGAVRAAPGVARRVRGAARAAGRAADQGRLQPRLHGPGRVRHERRHELRLHHLLRQCARQQAGTVVLDGVGSPAEPGLPRVLRRARRGARGAPPAHRQHADRQVPGAVRRAVLAVVAL